MSLDPSDDVGTLKDWLNHGGKDMLLTGDGLASDLAQSGSSTNDFLQSYMGISVLSTDVRPLIGNQATPMIQVIGDNPVFNGNLGQWIAYGGCFAINTFDAVNVFDTGQRLAEFLGPSGTANQYSYSAATLNIRNPGPDQSRIISMPVGLKFIMTDPAGDGHLLAARSRLLQDVLMYFNQVGDPGGVSDAPGRITFEAGNFPNPFNPATTISFSMPRAGHLKLSIYDVRGRLVRTLIDGLKPMGTDQTVVWDGSDNLGQLVSSGLYFYEAKTGGEVRIGKMTLVK
jgi:hypothetical protein